MKKYFYPLIAVALLAPHIQAQDAPKAVSLEYWIDDNHSSATVSSSFELDIDCKSLPQGLHTLHYRVADSNGRYSTLHEHGFFKVDAPATATKVETIQYWWDDMQQNMVTAPYTSEQITLPTDELSYGVHSLKYRVKDDAGRWSQCQSHYFYKGNVSDSSRIVSYSYWWNDRNDLTTTRQLETPAASFELDEDFTVPDEARTNFAGHYTATLNLAVTDNHGRTAFLTTDVTYPDNDAPQTDIDADKYVTTSTVKLTWTESSKDLMGDYNVYYSKDGGPFLLWLPDTKLTSATFKGERGSAYLFTVTGRDASGNREAYDETKCVSVTFE